MDERKWAQETIAQWLCRARDLEALAAELPHVGALVDHPRFREHIAILRRLNYKDDSPTHPPFFAIYLRAIDRRCEVRCLQLLNQLLSDMKRDAPARHRETTSTLVDRGGDNMGVVLELEFLARAHAAGVVVRLRGGSGPDFELNLAGEPFCVEVKTLMDRDIGLPPLKLGEAFHSSAYWPDFRNWSQNKLSDVLKRASRQAKRVSDRPTLLVLAPLTLASREDLISAWKQLRHRWQLSGLCGVVMRCGAEGHLVHCHPASQSTASEILKILAQTPAFIEDAL